MSANHNRNNNNNEAENDTTFLEQSQSQQTEKLSFIKAIYIERFHVMRGSQRPMNYSYSAMEDYIGIVLYQHNGQFEFTLNNVKCSAGDIFLYKSANIKKQHRSHSAHGYMHDNVFQQAFGVGKTKETAGIGFSFMFSRTSNKWYIGNSCAFNSNVEMNKPEKAQIQKSLDRWFKDGTRDTSANLTVSPFVYEIRNTFHKSANVKPPMITMDMKWGALTVDFNGQLLSFKDCILSPVRAQNWNWKHDGTRHKTGITIKAVERIIHECDIVILTKGMRLKLQVAPKTVAYLKQCEDISSVYYLETNAAVKKYQQLVTENRCRVGGLFHSTC